MEDKKKASILLLDRESRETNMDKLDIGNNLEMRPKVQFKIPRNNNKDHEGKRHNYRQRKGTNPFSADLKYRNMIGSRFPKEISDIFCIITSDDVEKLKKTFLKKSIKEKIRLFIRVIARADKCCILIALEFRSLNCLKYLLDLHSSLENDFRDMGIDLLESFYTPRRENVFHLLAARSFDLEMLEILDTNKRAKELINITDNEGNSPLLVSTKRNNFEMGEYLVKHGAKIDSLNKFGESPIGICIEKNESQLFRCFLENVQEDELADLIQDGNLYGGHTILLPMLTNISGFCCCYSVLQEMIPESLLNACFQQEIQDIEFLKETCIYCREDTAIEKVMELKIDFAHVKDDEEVTPLMWASSGGNSHFISKALSNAGWKDAIFASDKNGKTFIHHGVESNCLKLITQESVEQLCSTNGFLELLNKKDIREYTALHYAVCQGFVEAVATLTQLGACHEVLGPAPYYRSLLHYAVHSDESSVDGLLETVRNTHGSKAMMELINKGDFRKETALHLAARRGNAESVDCLLFNKASTTSDYKNRTPLHSAAEGGSTDVVSTLLEFEPDLLDKEDDKGKTALMVAAEKGHPEVVKLLLSHHAKITQDVKGKSCLDYAVDNRWQDVALVIIDSDPPIWREHSGLYIEFINEFNKVNVSGKRARQKSNVIAKVKISSWLEPFSKTVLEQSRNGPHSIMSKMVKTMDGVVCSILDKCITSEGEKNPGEFKINYDFFLLKKSSTGLSSPFLESMVECKSYNCLNHPIMVKFLTLSWHSPRVRGMYYACLLIYLVFLFSFTSYLVITKQDCDNCNLKSPERLSLAGICVAICVISLLLEIGQFLKGKMAYIKQRTNYLELAMFISTLIFFLPIWRKKSAVQWQAGAVGIFLAWIRFIWFLKIFAAFGIYIIMVKRVFLTVVKVFPLILPFLVAFGMAYYVLFPKDPGFNSVPLSIFLSLVLMSGEIDFRETFLKHKQSPHFVLRLITLLLFLLLVSITMMNLFTALAVGDTNEVLINSEQERLWQQANYILTLERLLPFLRYRALESYTEYPNKQVSDETEYSGTGVRPTGQARNRYSSIFQDIQQWLKMPEKPPDHVQVQRATSLPSETDEVKFIDNSEILEELLENSRTMETSMTDMKETIDVLKATVNRLENRLGEVQRKKNKK